MALEVVFALLIIGVIVAVFAFQSAFPGLSASPAPVQTQASSAPAAAAIASPIPASPTVSPAETAAVLPNPTLAASPTVDITAVVTGIPGFDQPVGPFNLLAHQVSASESLISIAARYGTTVEVLKHINNLTNTNALPPGLVLVAPVGVTVPEGLPRLVAFQTVQDTSLSAIVSQLSGDIENVRALNALGESDIVPTGRWLFIPQP